MADNLSNTEYQVNSYYSLRWAEEIRCDSYVRLMARSLGMTTSFHALYCKVKHDNRWRLEWLIASSCCIFVSKICKENVSFFLGNYFYIKSHIWLNTCIEQWKILKAFYYNKDYFLMKNILRNVLLQSFQTFFINEGENAITDLKIVLVPTV